MNQHLALSFIGGDPRQTEVIQNFALEGHKIFTFGIEDAQFSSTLPIQTCENLELCLDMSDIIILPFPYSNGNEIIKNSLSQQEININQILRHLKSSQILLAGRADNQLKNLAKLYNVHFIDYGEREELLILNAIPTVEGALEIAMKETSTTIHGSRCLVLGYGRIGKLLAKALHSLGANTTVSARKQRDLAWISAYGYHKIPFADLIHHIGTFDIIFNTIPTTILDYRMLSAIPDATLMIDLASTPGGIDFETAKILHKKVIWALSLPGKVAPKSAGKIIKDTIQNILDELGV